MAENENGNSAEEVVVEAVTPETNSSQKPRSKEAISDAASKTINEAFRQVESLGKALGSALQDRANVVMVRVNNDSLRYLDMLVEADITNSRSESAAFLINEGIKSNEALFNKIRDITDQIVELKTKLKEVVEVEE
jgi:hypothetical protein